MMRWVTSSIVHLPIEKIDVNLHRSHCGRLEPRDTLGVFDCFQSDVLLQSENECVERNHQLRRIWNNAFAMIIDPSECEETVTRMFLDALIYSREIDLPRVTIENPWRPIQHRILECERTNRRVVDNGHECEGVHKHHLDQRRKWTSPARSIYLSTSTDFLR